MKSFLIIFAFVLTVNFCKAQNKIDVYLFTSAKADSLFNLRDYQNAVNLYEQAFKINNGLGKVIHRYKAASCFALLNKSDSAFNELEKIAYKGNFTKYEILTSDSTFNSLHSTPKWSSIIQRIKENGSKPKVIIDN